MRCALPRPHLRWIRDSTHQRTRARLRAAGAVRHDSCRKRTSLQEAPDAGEEAVDALHARGAPDLAVPQWAHEHLVQPEGVGSVLLDDDVWADHVAA
jgi:hypothetical protein